LRITESFYVKNSYLFLLEINKAINPVNVAETAVKNGDILSIEISRIVVNKKTANDNITAIKMTKGILNILRILIDLFNGDFTYPAVLRELL